LHSLSLVAKPNSNGHNSTNVIQIKSLHKFTAFTLNYYNVQ
jgi:hypothetical protein